MDRQLRKIYLHFHWNSIGSLTAKMNKEKMHANQYADNSNEKEIDNLDALAN